jgi:UDP-N-acetylglucosamine 1-carboxyvinyltransferase
MQAQMSVLMTLASGSSVLSETVFENRFQHLEEMTRMGAKFRISGNVAYIDGVVELQGAEVSATDLRAAAALVIAGLVADGETRVHHLEYLDRGYYNFHKKLQALGADVERINETQVEEALVK